MPIYPEKLVWFASGGGPFLLVSASNLRSWNGILGTTTPEQPLTDYDHACLIDDSLGFLRMQTGEYLVLNTEGNQSAWMAFRGSQGIVVWEQAESEDDIIALSEAALLNQIEQEWRYGAPEKSVPFHVAEEECFLIDSAYPGQEAIKDNEYLRIALPPGLYEVTAESYWDEKDSGITLHRFLIRPHQTEDRNPEFAR